MRRRALSSGEKRMKVFLSHSSSDEATARMIMEKIQELGASVYMAEDDPKPGCNLTLKLNGK